MTKIVPKREPSPFTQVLLNRVIKSNICAESDGFCIKKQLVNYVKSNEYYQKQCNSN